MSRLNGEKSRAAMARRNRNARRVRTRELRKQFLENASKPKPPAPAPKRPVKAALPTPPPAETPPQKAKRSTSKKATPSDKQA